MKTTNTNGRRATSPRWSVRVRVMVEIERYAALYARWSRSEISDRVLANARKRVEREVAR